MKRKDLEFLAHYVNRMLRTGDMSPFAANHLANELDNNYSNFNRDRFDAATEEARAVSAMKRAERVTIQSPSGGVEGGAVPEPSAAEVRAAFDAEAG